MDATRWLKELLNPKKATYPLISEYGMGYSWNVLPDYFEEALLGFMYVNDIAEISLAGVTSQLQLFGQIGMASAAAVSDMARNVLLDQPTTNKEMIDKKTSLFYDFLE